MGRYRIFPPPPAALLVTPGRNEDHPFPEEQIMGFLASPIPLKIVQGRATATAHHSPPLTHQVTQVEMSPESITKHLRKANTMKETNSTNKRTKPK